MQSVDLKAMAERAVGEHWDEFARRHPHLAKAIDQQLLVERTLQGMRGSSEFAEALRRVEAGAAEAGALEEIVGRVARVILLAL